MNGEADSTVLVSNTTLDAETVGAASEGLTIEIDTTAPDQPTINAPADTDFTINNPGYVDIGIYDIKGRWVINLIGKHMNSGKYSTAWSGTDMSGNFITSGTYLVAMKFGSSYQTKKVNLIK